MNTLYLPRPEDRGRQHGCAGAASPVENTPRPFRYTMAAEPARPGPGCYLMRLRERYANDTRLRFHRVSATQT